MAWGDEAPAANVLVSDKIQFMDITVRNSPLDLHQFEEVGISHPLWFIPWEAILGYVRGEDFVLFYPLLAPKKGTEDANSPSVHHRSSDRNNGAQTVGAQHNQSNLITIDFRRGRKQ